jgi:hypothetical protein
MSNYAKISVEALLSQDSDFARSVKVFQKMSRSPDNGLSFGPTNLIAPDSITLPVGIGESLGVVTGIVVWANGPIHITLTTLVAYANHIYVQGSADDPTIFVCEGLPETGANSITAVKIETDNADATIYGFVFGTPTP